MEDELGTRRTERASKTLARLKQELEDAVSSGSEDAPHIARATWQALRVEIEASEDVALLRQIQSEVLEDLYRSAHIVKSNAEEQHVPEQEGGDEVQRLPTANSESIVDRRTPGRRRVSDMVAPFTSEEREALKQEQDRLMAQARKLDADIKYLRKQELDQATDSARGRLLAITTRITDIHRLLAADDE